MTNVGQSERTTQNRVVTLFREQLDYDYLGVLSQSLAKARKCLSWRQNYPANAINCL